MHPTTNPTSSSQYVPPHLKHQPNQPNQGGRFPTSHVSSILPVHPGAPGHHPVRFPIFARVRGIVPNPHQQGPIQRPSYPYIAVNQPYQNMTAPPQPHAEPQLRMNTTPRLPNLVRFQTTDPENTAKQSTHLRPMAHGHVSLQGADIRFNPHSGANEVIFSELNSRLDLNKQVDSRQNIDEIGVMERSPPPVDHQQSEDITLQNQELKSETVAIEALLQLSREKHDNIAINANCASPEMYRDYVKMNNAKRKREEEFLPRKIRQNTPVSDPLHLSNSRNSLFFLKSRIRNSNHCKKDSTSTISFPRDIDDIYYEDAKSRERDYNESLSSNPSFTDNEIQHLFGTLEIRKPESIQKRSTSNILYPITFEAPIPTQPRSVSAIDQDYNDTQYGDDDYIEDMNQKPSNTRKRSRSKVSNESSAKYDSDSHVQEHDPNTKLIGSKNPWTQAEVRALYEGFSLYPREWKKIQKHNTILKHRTAISVKEKYRKSMVKAWDGDEEMKSLINEYIDFDTFAFRDNIKFSSEQLQKRRLKGKSVQDTSSELNKTDPTQSSKTSTSQTYKTNQNDHVVFAEESEKTIQTTSHMDGQLKWTQEELDSLYYIHQSYLEDPKTLNDWNVLLDLYPFLETRTRSSIQNKYSRMKAKGKLSRSIYGKPVFSRRELFDLKARAR